MSKVKEVDRIKAKLQRVINSLRRIEKYVTKIQNLTSEFKWLYINTKENPADFLSRGLDPQSIENNKLWFHGPSKFLDVKYSHKENEFDIPHPLLEERVTVNVKQIANCFAVFERFSNLLKLQRVIAYTQRFIFNSKKKNKNVKLSGTLKAVELDNALKLIIKIEQHSKFQEEIKLLKNELNPKSLRALVPFIDGDGMLRVGGRLHNANISYGQKHPLILPKSSHITDFIISHEHKRLLHAGPKLVLSSLSSEYWLINGIREIKKITHKCIICFKHKAKCSEQLMGSLPEKRVCAARAFENVGIDFCGPFMMRQSRLRRSIKTKAYIALYICFVVKAVHLELLSDLTTETFLASFKRFIARRGKPSNVYCDNGATFKGANNELTRFYENSTKIEEYSSGERIQFHFIPSYSPVFGGLWEAGVKSTKFHLKRAVGNHELTYEEFNTLIVQIEGILNSRPLISLGNDPSSFDYLTPGHFLIGTSITSYPEPNISQVPSNRLKFWKLCVQMQQTFWSKWHNDYLTLLQSRPKWHKDLPNPKEGMLVLIRDENAPSFSWPVGRIIRLIPGKDGKVRVIEIKTNKGTYLRSITKIAILPIHEEAM